MEKQDDLCQLECQDQESMEHSIESDSESEPDEYSTDYDSMSDSDYEAEETCQEQQEKTTFDELIAPEESVVFNIFSRLSVHCLLKCKAVNKLWKSLIEDKYFISELHLDRAPCHYFPPFTNNNYILDSFCGLVWVTREDPGLVMKHYISNPATRQVLHLPDPNHALLRSPQTYKAPTISRLKSYIALNSFSHECKLLLECRLTNSQGIMEHALETFEVGRDFNWTSIGRKTGLLDDPDYDAEDLARMIHVRNMGVLHFIQVLVVGSCKFLRVRSIDVWDDKYVVTNGLPRRISFNILKAHFIDLDDCLAIAEINHQDLHLLKMTKYVGGVLRWNTKKMIVPLTFLSKQPYSNEIDQVVPWGFKSDVLRFKFKNEVFDYDTKTERIDKIDELVLRDEQLKVGEFEYFPSLMKLEGMIGG
ncbi:uncharacterized protein LOC115704868 [Cannabis sativa]|uniref:F-box domain-containing protein n=1 Tax=Cannabis sativa TaxID=3483 RepID=A0A7J6GVK3_CANSA|nr:uncharacterized protein LOC115704868 [Cannabis sativa]KAF4386964.1 hypothetical protein F8388_006919 [Cannabis sativa]